LLAFGRASVLRRGSGYGSFLSEGARATRAVYGTVIPLQGSSKASGHISGKQMLQTLAFNASVDTVTLRDGKSIGALSPGTDSDPISPGLKAFNISFRFARLLNSIVFQQRGDAIDAGA